MHLIDHIAEISNFDHISNNLEVSLYPPTVLQLQMIELAVTSVTNLINVLAEMKSVHINPIALLKKYVPFIDWVEIINESDILNQKEKSKMANAAMAAAAQQQGGGM